MQTTFVISPGQAAVPIINRPMPIVRPEVIAISAAGENVTMQIGNAPLTFHYETALKVSAMMRLSASRVRKRIIGEQNRVKSTLGTAHNSSAKKLRSQPRGRVNAPNAIVRPGLIDLDRVTITDEGQSVLMTIGNSTLTLFWMDAIKIAQWIRVRAKEARNTAGDTRHWSKLVEQG